MNEKLTDITLIIDRSGSMESCRIEAQNGVNEFIQSQRNGAGDALLTLVQFDDDYEIVYSGKPIQKALKYILQPRGWTALLDAVGKTIDETGKRLAAMPEADRPGLVVIAIVTDGMENRSREYNRQQIRDMIKHQQEKYAWRFEFLAANQDAFMSASSIGINANDTLAFATGNSSEAYAALGAKSNRMREAFVQHGARFLGSVPTPSYTPLERSASVGDSDTK